MEIIRFKNTIWDELRLVNEKMERVFRDSTDPCGLTLMQLRLLVEIAEHPNATVGSLSKTMSMAGANCSVMCKRLEKCGLIERFRSPEDERVVQMRLTEAGSNAVEETTRSLRQRYEPIIREEPRENINAILDGLSRLNDLLVRMEEASCSDSTNTSIPTKE